MGTDKATLDLSGEALLDRVITQLEPLASDLVLACGASERYLERGLPVVMDRVPDSGPLGGIAAGLESVREERALVVACDMPRVNTELLRVLLERAASQDLDVCWFESERGIEPLCAVYSRRCLGPMRLALADGRRKVTDFLTPDLRAGVVRYDELDQPLMERDCAVNLNTPDELARERAHWKQEGLDGGA